MVGRTGLFVAGWFMLGAVHTAYFNAAAWLVGFGVDVPESLPATELLPAGVLASIFACGLLGLAALTRGRASEPLGVIAASAAAHYVALAGGLTLHASGVTGDALFWSVVGVAVIASVIILLWVPHPFLGLNAAVAVGVAVVSLPIARGSEPGIVVVTKSLLLGLTLVALAFIVEVRTRSRASSLLHYAAVGCFAVAEVVSYNRLSAGMGAAALLEFGLLALAFGLIARRRSWALLGWITVEFFAFALARAMFGLRLDLTGLGIVAIPLVGAALAAQRAQDHARHALLSGLPPRVREALDV